MSAASGGGRPRRRAAEPEREDLRGIDEELRFHIEGRVDALMAEGVSEEEARARALAAFGDVQRVRAEMSRIEAERARQERRRGVLQGFWQDVRQGGRRLVRTPVQAIAAVLTLGLGVGASVAVFSVLDAVLLRPLPYAGADRLVEISVGRTVNVALSRELGELMPTVESYSGISRWRLTLTGEAGARTLAAEVVDAGYFEMLRVQPLIGRVFTREETDPARSDVVLLSHALWQTHFGGDPGVLGRRLPLDGHTHESFEVIGVMPRGFRAVGSPGSGQAFESADVWLPLGLPVGRQPDADSTWYVSPLIARVAPGVAIGQVAQDVRAATALVRERYPGLLSEEQARDASAVRLIDSMVGSVRGTLWLVLGSVGLVLLIGCANLANLQMARAAGRRRDLALRAALGASRARLVREQLLEGALLALAGGGLGVLFAVAALRGLQVAEASGLPRVHDAGVDVRALGFALLLSVVCVLLFALLPAWRAASLAPREELHESGRGTAVSRSTRRASRALVVFELALSMVLVSAAGLVLSSFLRLRSVDPGLDAADVLVVRLAPSARRYGGDAAQQLYHELETRLGALPGITAVGAIQLEPFSGGNWAFPYLAEGQTPRAGTPLPSANFRVITPGYFDAVDMPLLAGRRFDGSDRDGAPRAIILSESFARSLWPERDAVGRELRVFGSMAFRVVGVVGDVRQHSLDREPSFEMYVAHAQWSGLTSMALMIEAPRAAALAPAVRASIHDLDADIAIETVRPLVDVLGDSLARRRFFTSLLGAFGLLALVLGGVGVYGVTAHLVGTTLRDAGVRLALGASPAGVLRRVLWTGFSPAMLGVALGTVAALGSARLLRGLLFAIEPIHPPVYTAVAAVLLAVALLATWLPARRASRLDPLLVLRSE